MIDRFFDYVAKYTGEDVANKIFITLFFAAIFASYAVGWCVLSAIF